MKNIKNKGLIFEKKLEKLLKRKGYKILNARYFGGEALHPDFLLKKDDKNILVELKATNIVTEKTLYQIMYYMQKSGVDLAYLALPKEYTIKKIIKEKLLSNNIGLITINEEELVFEDPKPKKELSSSDLIDYDLFLETKSSQEKVDALKQELKDMFMVLFLHILAGGLLFYSLSGLLNFFLGELGSFLGALAISLFVVIIIFIFYRNKIKKEESF